MTLVTASIVSIKFIDYAYDDAYITYRYAKNILLGNGFVYNLEHNYLGTTTPLYALILAGLGFIIDIPIASGLLSLLSILGCIYFFEMVGRLEKIRNLGVLIGVFIILNPWIYHIFGGETLFTYLFLVPLGFLFYKKKYYTISSIVFGLAILSRMDAGLFVCIVYVSHALKHHEIPFRQIITTGLTLLPWFVYSFAVFQQPFPSTLEAKIAQGESGLWPMFLKQGWRYFCLLNEYSLFVKYIFIPVLFLGIIRVLFIERIWLCFVIHSVLFVLVYQYVFGASFSHWYLANIYLSNALLLSAGIRQLSDMPSIVSKYFKGIGPTGVKAFQWVVNLLLLVSISIYLAYSAIDVIKFDTDPPRKKIYTALGHWLHENTDKDATVAFIEIGYMGYYSERTVIDFVGLVTPDIADKIKDGDFLWAFEKYKPDYFVYNKIVFGPQIGQVFNLPWFKTRYKLVKKIHQDGYGGSPLEVYKRV